MSDACGRCAYDPRQRAGDRACPFTTLYWAFFASHRERFADHLRVRFAVQSLDKLADRPALKRRARLVLQGLERGGI
ncbi:MAG TPA: hypothetical protein VGI70_19475 [Polyangiales bacterium]